MVRAPPGRPVPDWHGPSPLADLQSSPRLWSVPPNAFLWQIRHNPDMRYSLPALASLLCCIAAGAGPPTGTDGTATGSMATVLAQGRGAPPSAGGPGFRGTAFRGTGDSSRPQRQPAAVAAIANRAASSRAAIAPLGKEQAQALGRDVLAALERRDSVVAKIRFQVRAFDQRLAGTGSYQQEGRGEHRVWRFELRMEVADQLASWQQVADGQHLWVHQHLLESNSLTRIDLARVRAALADRGQRPGAAPPSKVWLSLGGLPKLLHAWLEAFDFDAAAADELDGVPVWKLSGKWQGEPLAALVPALGEAPRGGRAKQSDLPEPVPSRVVLLVGRDDLFPYRWEYWRRGPSDAAGKALEQPLAVMEWYEVQLDGPIDRRAFNYRPGDLEVYDQTSSFLRSLGLGEAKK